MASVPPRRVSQRRSSPPEAESSQAQLPRSNSEAISAVSEDSQTILLNSPSETLAETTAQQDVHSEQGTSSTHHQQTNEDDVRKCWICFSDETEDTPLSSEWRSPCPCALVAHEECLLDWVAELEAPTARQRAGQSKEVRCPQCKAEIHISQPRSLIVEAVRKLNELASDLVLPWGAIVVSGALITASFAHGTATIIAVFGKNDSQAILRPLVEASESWSRNGLAKLFRDHWRLPIGIPLIPPILIVSRMGGAWTDTLLPIAPVLFFATAVRTEDMVPPTWPPSAAMGFAILPYVRTAYKSYLEIVWSRREREWFKQVLPRSTQTGDGANGDDERLQVDEEGVLEIDVDIVDEWEENEEVAREHEQNQQQRHEEPQQQNDRQEAGAPPPNAAPGPDVNAAAPEQPAQDAPRGGRNGHNEGRWVIGMSRVLDTVLGALAFPGIAAAMGGMLKLALPRRLTTLVPGKGGRPTGLLQTQWGRSIVGGCLFVALKDAVILYVRWRLAQNHNLRKIRNYDKVAKRIVDGPEHTRITL